MPTKSDVTALASAARTATAHSNDFAAGRGCVVYLNATVKGGAAPSITVSIEAKDPVSGNYTALLTSAALTDVGSKILTLYPGATASANVAVGGVLPQTWRITVTHGNTDSITYSVGVSIID